MAKNINNTVTRAVDFIIDRLKEEGAVIQLYRAKSTNSAYIKIDFGVGGTIRISDHKGKKHLHYRYNLLLNSNRHKTNHGGLERFYFPFRDIELMLEKILYDRRVKMEKYDSRYAKFMRENEMSNANNRKGFWADAILVK